MRQPDISVDEEIRLQRLREAHVLFTPAEERFDAITRLACQIFDVPIAVVSLVAEQCQWFKSIQGLAVDQTPREISFCGHAVLKNDAFIVEDALKHPDFCDNPLVIGTPYIRFYAGHPIYFRNQPIGTLCLIDHSPRSLDETQIMSLRGLAKWVENELKKPAINDQQNNFMQELDQEKRQQMIDPITKTWNRQAFEAILYRECMAARITGKAISMCLLQIERSDDATVHISDDSKTWFDIAGRIRSCLNNTDICGKYTNNQFLCMISNDNQNDITKLIERISIEIAAMTVTEGTRAIPLKLRSSMITTIEKEECDVAFLLGHLTRNL